MEKSQFLMKLEAVVHNCTHITRYITLHFLVVSAVCYDSSERPDVKVFEWKRHNTNRAQEHQTVPLKKNCCANNKYSLVYSSNSSVP